MSGIIDILSKSQLFGGLSETHLKEIMAISIEKNVDRDEIIFFDGDDGNGFYLVIEGIVKVYKVSPEGKEQILHIVRTGETIGAVPVFSGKSFPANAQAIAKSLLLYFPKKTFIELITGNADLTMNILAILSMRLREFTIQVENLSLKEIPSRLAAYLLYQSQQQGGRGCISLDLKKSQISNLLGTGPESLSRALGLMKEQNMIEVKGSNIFLIDREALNNLAYYGKKNRSE